MLIEKLLDNWMTLEKREREILVVLSDRLRMGQAQYGRWEPGKKNNAKEAFEEACDLAIYTANGMLEVQQGVGEKAASSDWSVSRFKEVK